MQLKLKRSQRTGGVMSTKIYFCLDARVELTAQERSEVDKYKLGKLCIYNSEAAKKHLDASVGHLASGSAMGVAKSFLSIAMASLNLNITIDGLTAGTHVECKDMDELLGAEAAVLTACENLKTYLDTATTFDGQEVVVEFAEGKAKRVA